jgi:hypothetical protein
MWPISAWEPPQRRIAHCEDINRNWSIIRRTAPSVIDESAAWSAISETRKLMT